MVRKREAGFNLIELAVVVGVAALAMVVLFRSYHDGITRAVARVTGMKGGEIYAALTAATLDREPLLGPQCWPAVADPAAEANAVGLSAGGFANSTDFFRYLLENRLCVGLSYDSLVTGGVPVGRRNAFTATNNIWTVAVHVDGAASDMLPVLLTRNVDLSPLVTDAKGKGLSQRLVYDVEWGTPFNAWGFVCVRKGGAVFIGRSKRTTYNNLFPGGFPRHAGVDGSGRAVSKPLTYLTPTRAVVPGGGA